MWKFATDLDRMQVNESVECSKLHAACPTCDSDECVEWRQLKS